MAAYRAARAQEPLFALRGERAATGHDECLDAHGAVRPAWRAMARVLDAGDPADLRRRRAAVASLTERDGITYTDVGAPGGPVTAPWRLDALPLIVDATEWEDLERGLVARSRLLEAVLADLYGPRRCLTSGLLPPQLLFGHPGYLRVDAGVLAPGRSRLLLHACDVSRGPDGWAVNADWTQAPSGVGYALADRRIVAHAHPDLVEAVGPRPVSPFVAAMRLALVEAAPHADEDPVVVVHSPGTLSETAFDQAYLAGVLGYPLVESADLTVRDGTLWMRSLGTHRRVDVVLRRVDAAYADPLDLDPTSRLGVAGLCEAQRRGTVAVVNALGSGILESAGIARFLPALSRLLLDEAPQLDTPPMYWAGLDDERSHLLAHLATLLVRPTTGGPAIVGPTLDAAARADLAARIEAQPWRWVGQELPRFASAPTDGAGGTLVPGEVGVRLFSVATRGGHVAMAGGLGQVMASGPGAFTLGSVAAKDVWVQPASMGAGPAREVTTAAPTVGAMGRDADVTSPRVLADLYWFGRYAERTEATARLLLEIGGHHGEAAEGERAEHLPALLDMLAGLTGGEVADAPAAALRALTVDPARDGSVAQSVERLAAAARAVRDQMSGDTWTVLGAVQRALVATAAGDAPEEAQRAALAGMLALAGVAGESMIRDTGWTLADAGKRLERCLVLTALLTAALTDVRTVAVERAVTESLLVVCESAVTYRRRTLGAVSVGAVAQLLLFDTGNPRSLAYNLDRLRQDMRALPAASGTSRPVRSVDDVQARLRRVEPADLTGVRDGRREGFADVLSGIHADLRALSDVVTATALTVPGDQQPLDGAGPRETS